VASSQLNKRLLEKTATAEQPGADEGEPMNELLRSSLLLFALATGANDPQFKPKQILHGHNGAVQSLAYSPGTKTLASASADGTVRLWDAATGKERATLKSDSGGVNCVAFSPDGKTIKTWKVDEVLKQGRPPPPPEKDKRTRR
jgi:WD40 repeat protein